MEQKISTTGQPHPIDLSPGTQIPQKTAKLVCMESFDPFIHSVRVIPDWSGVHEFVVDRGGWGDRFINQFSRDWSFVGKP